MVNFIENYNTFERLSFNKQCFQQCNAKQAGLAFQNSSRSNQLYAWSHNNIVGILLINDVLNIDQVLFTAIYATTAQLLVFKLYCEGVIKEVLLNKRTDKLGLKDRKTFPKSG